MSEFSPGGMTYHYDPADAVFEEGVTSGWIYLHQGKAGPALALKVDVLADGSGVAYLVPGGEWMPVNVVADPDNERP